MTTPSSGQKTWLPRGNAPKKHVSLAVKDVFVVEDEFGNSHKRRTISSMANVIVISGHDV